MPNIVTPKKRKIKRKRKNNKRGVSLPVDMLLNNNKSNDNNTSKHKRKSKRKKRVFVSNSLMLNDINPQKKTKKRQPSDQLLLRQSFAKNINELKYIAKE